MTIIVSFVDYTPVPRYDNEPWTDVQIEESDAIDGTWTIIDTITFAVPDPDPSEPASRSFTTDQGTAADQWYRATFVDGNGNMSLPTVPLENTSTARVPYATTTELAGILHVTESSNLVALTRVLTAAAAEIDAELGRAAPFAEAPDLVVEVNLERAVEHWQQMKSPFGILGLGSEAGGTFTATDSWSRHAAKLMPYKESFGIA